MKTFDQTITCCLTRRQAAARDPGGLQPCSERITLKTPELSFLRTAAGILRSPWVLRIQITHDFRSRMNLIIIGDASALSCRGQGKPHTVALISRCQYSAFSGHSLAGECNVTVNPLSGCQAITVITDRTLSAQCTPLFPLVHPP